MWAKWVSKPPAAASDESLGQGSAVPNRSETTT